MSEPEAAAEARRCLRYSLDDEAGRGPHWFTLAAPATAPRLRCPGAVLAQAGHDVCPRSVALEAVARRAEQWQVVQVVGAAL